MSTDAAGVLLGKWGKACTTALQPQRVDTSDHLASKKHLAENSCEAFYPPLFHFFRMKLEVFHPLIELLQFWTYNSSPFIIVIYSQQPFFFIWGYLVYHFPLKWKRTLTALYLHNNYTAGLKSLYHYSILKSTLLIIWLKSMVL